MITFDIEVIEQAHKVLDMLIFLEEFIEDGAVYHVVYDTYVKMFALGLIRIIDF